MTGRPAAGRDDGPGRRPRAAARRAGHRRDRRPGGTDRRWNGVADRKLRDEHAGGPHTGTALASNRNARAGEPWWQSGGCPQGRRPNVPPPAESAATAQGAARGGRTPTRGVVGALKRRGRTPRHRMSVRSENRGELEREPCPAPRGANRPAPHARARAGTLAASAGQATTSSADQARPSTDGAGTAGDGSTPRSPGWQIRCAAMSCPIPTRV